MSDSSPWYQNGLRFKCTQCGDCCTGSPGYVWLNREEIARIADQLDIEVDEFKQVYTKPVGRRSSLRERANGDCVLLGDDRKCTVYSARPRQCRSWPFWESNLQSPLAWQETCEICPGAGRGDIIPVEDISEKLRMIRV